MKAMRMTEQVAASFAIGLLLVALAYLGFFLGSKF